MAKRETRQDLVEAAANLFATQGYAATSVGQILSEAGTGSGSMYHFFGSKENLALAVVEYHRRQLEERILKPAFERTRSGVGRVLAVLGYYEQALMRDNYRGGCPVGNLAAELADTSETIRKAADEYFAVWRTAIRDCLESAGEELAATVDRNSLAALVLSVMEGGVMQARAARSVEPLRQSIRQLRTYFQMLTSQSGRDVPERVELPPSPAVVPAEGDSWKNY